MKTFSTPIVVGILLLGTVIESSAAKKTPNPLIDFAGHRQLVLATEEARKARLLVESEFIEMARRRDSVVLDARSAEMFGRMHVEGAVNLSFPDFTEQTLARVIPTKKTRVLIYCNNNFVGSPDAFPAKEITIALNISTAVALRAYGYDNVYELEPLLDVRTTKVRLAGSRVDESQGKR